MKKTVTVESSFCDVCEAAVDYATTCDHCGKEFCHNCSTAHVKRYSHGIYVSGSGDGHYCNECDTKLAESGDSLHAAYRKIAALRVEAEAWSEQFRIRSKAAELRIEELRK